MSAYTNPETYIDTQSAQHLRNLQSTIAGSFAKVAESYAARQAEIKKQNEITEKENKALEIDKAKYTLGQYDELTKAVKGDTTINWSEAFSPLIDEGAKLNLGIDNRTSKEPQKDLLKIAKIKAAIPQAGKVLSNLSGQGTILDEAMAIGLGKQGGVYSKSETKTLRFVNVLQKKLPGGRAYGFENNDPELPFITAKNDSVYGDISYNVNVLEKIMEGNSDLIITVPDQRPKFDVAKTTSANIFESQDIVRDKATVKLPNGRITNDFLTKDKNKKTVKLREENIIDAGQNKVTKFVADVDIASIRGDVQLNTNLKAQAEALQTNELQYKAYMNDIVIKDLNRINKNDAFPDYDMRTPLTEDQKIKSIELYKEHFFKTQIPLTQDVVDPDSDLYTKTYEPKEPATASNSSGGNSATAAQPRLTQNEIKNYLTEYSNLAAGKQDVLELTLTGPKGGISKPRKFMVDEKTKRVTDLENGKIYNTRKEFEDYLQGLAKPRL